MSTLAVVVFSGGLDSTTALAEAVKEHNHVNVHALTFHYGQKHFVEVHCAEKIAEYYDVRHTLLQMNQRLFKGGSLTTEAPIKDMRYDDLPSGQMSPTYVPFRNGNLLAQAAAYADSTLREEDRVWGIESPWDNALIYAGMHAEDAAGFAYADCTPEFLGAMASAIYIGSNRHVRLNALYQHATKMEIIKRGLTLLVPYEMTHSCYRGERPACGACSTCHARLEAFDAAGVDDPLEYKVRT